MNKFTLLAVAGLLSFNVQAQEERVINSHPVNAKPQSSFLQSAATNIVARGGVPATISVAFSDDFSLPNDTDGLKARGYIPYYRGDGPQAAFPTWFQGIPANWNAFNGATDSYVMANYQVVDAAAPHDIDSWLVLPSLNVATGDILSFYSRSVLGSIYPDSIKVMYSAAGDSVPEALTWVQLGNFVVNTAGVWEQKTFAAPAAGATGRFAIRYAVVNGGFSGVNSNLIGIDQLDVYTPAAVDGGVSAISGIADGCGLSAATPVAITIYNSGAAALTSVPVSFTVNGGSPVNETFTGSIAPLTSGNYTFTGTADLSAPGTTYTINAYTTIATDGNAGNDTSSVTVTNAAPADLGVAALTMGFEITEDLTGWTIADNNLDGTTWTLIDNVTAAGINAHSGDWCVRRAGSGSDDNDWLFTKCIQLNTGTNYSVACFYKDFELVNPADFDIALGAAADEASMTQNLLPLQTPGDTTWQAINQSFTVAASGVYYIGFHSSSALGTGTSSQRLDDINISIITGIKENDGANMVSVSPNPTNGLVNVYSRYNEKTAVSVYNNMGQEVASYNFNQAFKTQIDLSAFANGIYTIRLNSANQSVVNKIVLNK